MLLGNEGRGAKLFCTNVEAVPPRRQLEGTKAESYSRGPVLTIQKKSQLGTSRLM